MSSIEFKKLDQIATKYELFLFDLWGVAIEDTQAYPGVADKLNELMKNKKVIFLTNAPRPNYVIAKKLQELGVNADKNQIVTSGDVTRHYIKRHFHDKNIIPQICHLGEERNDQILENIEHKSVNIEDADLFLISLYRNGDETIEEYTELLKKAAKIKNLPILCANPDVKAPNGELDRYCAGYFASIVEQHGGKVQYMGKPEKIIYSFIFEQYPDIAKDKILMIGDTFETDILGASNSNIHSALVLTGNSKKIHGQHKEREQKLDAINKHAKNFEAKPNFVISIL